MDVVEILSTIPRRSLRSYTWVARQLGYEDGAARAAGQVIARETENRWPTPEAERRAESLEQFPWWRVVGRDGDVLTIRETDAWYHRQVERLQEEGHTLVPSSETDGLRVNPLPTDFA